MMVDEMDEAVPGLEPSREFRDPVHGFVPVYEHEKAIIDTPPFQRLRRIHQLALGSYVYHGAEHTRFGHSLGVMHLAGEAMQRIIGKNFSAIQSQLEWTADPGGARRSARRLCFLTRLAGLLHDIGHAPFSHTGEGDLFPERVGGDRHKHEEYSVAIVQSSPIAELIDGSTHITGVTTADVCEVFNPRSISAPQFVREIISSPWDVDKMDYLLRDAMYCGVEYGRYDLKRLVSCLTLTPDPGGSLRLAVEEGGFHVLESLLLARYFMFTQVYFHDVRRAYDLVLTEFIGDVLAEQKGRRSYPGPDAVDEYLMWDDSVILAQAVPQKDKARRNFAWQILARDHPKAIYSTMPHPSPITAGNADQLCQRLRAKYVEVRFWLDRAVDHPEKYRKQDIPIVREREGKPLSFASQSKALGGLDEIGQVRIYADVGRDAGLRAELERFCEPYRSAEI